MNTHIENRTRELMLDEVATVDLLEEIQAENGPMQQAMMRALRHVLENPPRSIMHEFGLNYVTHILIDRARLRAARELSQGAIA